MNDSEDNIVDFDKQKSKHLHLKKEKKVKDIKSAFKKAFDIDALKKSKQNKNKKRKNKKKK